MTIDELYKRAEGPMRAVLDQTLKIRDERDRYREALLKVCGVVRSIEPSDRHATEMYNIADRALAAGSPDVACEHEWRYIDPSYKLPEIKECCKCGHVANGES